VFRGREGALADLTAVGLDGAAHLATEVGTLLDNRSL
jgi:hypothetical protein